MNIPIYAHANTYYVTWRIERILMVQALGEYAALYDDAPAYQSNMAIIQHVELLSSLLLSGDERFTYEIRMVSHPNHAQPGRGRIEVYCIVAMRGTDKDEAHEHALSLYRLFNSHFRDVVWQVVDDVATLLRVDDAHHAVSLTRSSGFIAHDRSTTDSTYGLVAQRAPTAHANVDTRMFFVSAFMASGHQIHAVFDYMLQHPAPVTVSIRVQRTQLTAAEMRFLQDNLDTFSAAQKYPAAVAEQLTHYQSMMNGMLLRSFSLAALLNIDVVSPHDIPTQLITLIGNLITQPAGGMSVGQAKQALGYYGGYTVIHHDDAHIVTTAIRTVCMRPLATSETPVLDRLVHVVDVNQAAAAFHIPRSSLIAIPGMQMQSHRQLRPPSDLSETGTIIGQYHEHGITKPVHISEIDRTRHTYVIGQTGTGKSTVLKSMVLDDITKGRGVCVIDPHGDLVNEILAQIPADRHDDVIVIDPTHTDAPIGLNLFEHDTQEEREIAIQLFQKIVELVERARGTSMKFMGAQFWQHLRNNAYWVTQDKQDPGTVVEFYNMYAIKDFYKRWMPFDKQDTKLVSWYNYLQNGSYHEQHEGTTTFSYFASKFEDFVFDSRIRAIFGQKHSTFDIFEAMNTQKIILINLSRGLLSEIASAFMGGVILAKLQQAALKRALLPAQQRRMFSIYVDEFQNYTSDSFVSLLSESRKYGIALTLANQFLTQIENPRIIAAILGNVGTIIAFRIGLHDGQALQPRFAPEVEPTDLINLPNWQAYVSTQVNGQSRRPFSMQTMRPREVLDQEIADTVIAQSKRRYGRPRREVESVLAQSMLLKRTVTAKALGASATVALTTYPTPYELITSSTHSTQTVVIHGSGLSLWHRANSIDAPHMLMYLGLHAHLMQSMLATPLDTLLPIQQQRGAYMRFRTWCNEHNVKTLDDAIRCMRYQQSIGEHDKHVQAYCHALLAFQMHQSRPEAKWRDVALTQQLAVALDAHQQAWIWSTNPAIPAQHMAGVVALAGSESQVFVLKADGHVARIAPDGITDVADLHSIVQLTGGQHVVIAIDAHGQLHPVNAQQDFIQRFDAIPIHSAVSMVASGTHHVIAYDATPQVIAWGRNDGGCCVIPSELAHATVVALAAGHNRSFALDANGRLYAWGRHELTSTTLQTLNAHGVQCIACYYKDFICRTADGSWWHNNNLLMIPESLSPRHITRIVSNYSGSWLVMRDTDTITAWMTLATQSLSTLAGIDTDIALALRREGINTVHQLCTKTHAELSALTWFTDNPDQLITVVAQMQAILAAAQLATSWPQQAFAISDAASTQSLYGWYVQPPSAQTLTDTDTDELDRMFEEMLRDLDD